MKSRKILYLIGILGILLIHHPSHASSIVDMNVGDRQIDANVQVDNLYSVKIRITFENVVGLNRDSISITAVPVDPRSVALLQRLGNLTSFTVPALFPVLISISPTPQSTLTFTGAVDIELSTSNLAFDTRLRLFKSPNGGNFDDITNFAGIGSYRVRGTSGDFSDFIIALDLRTNALAIDSKFTKLQYALSTHASRIDPATAQNLQTRLSAAKSSYDAGSKQQAIAHLEAMVEDIEADAGDKIPNTYRANDINTVNVAGDLRRHAATLIFSLRL